MFKLESYLTPWLLGYLDKYVKLKPEDFQLSLWGGDAVFNKLDLRLNVIESLTNIPITFKSGVIHELRIHIPWTRITSEPVVVTINTLEFVAKMKDTDSVNKTSPNSPDTSYTNLMNKSESSPDLQQQQQQVQPVPTSYIQNIISKILFNICIIVNNVIVKFVEDDMVLSFNMKSAECFSVNHLWEKAFVDVNTQNIHLRKILQLNDVTICLDKLDNRKSKNGKISFYQDPLIYRCSIQSRLDFKYSSSPIKNETGFGQVLKLMKLNFYCRKFDVSITDQQLPMVIRLFELIMAIVDGTLKIPDAELGQDINRADISLDETKFVEEMKTSLIDVKNVGEEPIESEDQGWLSWAWSYVPSVSNMMPLDETTIEANVKQKSEELKMIIGCYFDEFNLSFKLTQQTNQQLQQHNSKSYNFAHFLICTTKGIALEVDKKENFSHILFGISFINIRSIGECCCKLSPKPNENEIIFLKAGNDNLDDKTFHYLTDSLFEIVIDDPVSQSPTTDTEINIEIDLNVKIDSEADTERSRDKSGNIDESYGLRRFGAIFMDQLNSSINLNKSKNEDKINKSENEVDLSLELSPNHPDIFSLYFIFYGIELNLSANLIHRLVKLYDCSQSHSYQEPYSSLVHLNETEPGSPVEDQNPEKLAKKFEKYIPIVNYTFTFKDPIIKMHPYSHFLIAPIVSQYSNYECYLNLGAKYIYFSITRPLDEKALFDVVSKLPNPSKKLIYDSYVHNQLTADGLKLNLTITERSSLFKQETSLIEPCYFEFHFSNVIMSPKMWNKQYFPLKEFSLEIPILKLNLHKQFLFILNDYLDNYVYPLVNESMFTQIKHPYINKSQMKKAKLRQMIYKRLLNDFMSQHKFKKSEILSVCLNDLKAKHSTTKIMQIVQLNCNMCNSYLHKNDQTDEFVSLIETSNKTTGKNSNIKDFLVLRAQLPLNIESANSYIPDPLFIYANINQININITDEFLTWLSYKPTTRDNDELLNLLVLELFDDLNDPTLNEHVNLLNKSKLKKDQKLVNIETCSSSFLHTSKQSFIQSNQPSVKLDKSNVSILSSSRNQPTVIDTFYDLLKTLHLQISFKPILVNLSTKNQSRILVNLPKIDAKSAGTKCDLEEELLNSRLIELPCTYLRACEKTSNKLPWLVELRNFNSILINPLDQKQTFLISPIDFNALFTVKPKYHQYDNLLSSLSIVFNLEIQKNVDLNLPIKDLSLLVNWWSKFEKLILNFEHKIDYQELDKTNMFDRNDLKSNNIDEENDDTKSYSTISILKEYDLSSFEDGDDNEDGQHSQDYYGINLNEQEDHCSLSTGDLSSSSSSISNLGLKRNARKKKAKIQVVSSDSNNRALGLLSPIMHHMVQREKNEEQVKLNFSLNFSMLNLNLNLISDLGLMRVSLHKFMSQSDLNNVYQKLIIKLKKFEVKNEPSSLIVTSDAGSVKDEDYFMEFTYTNALISNLNKKLDIELNNLNNRKSRRVKSVSKPTKQKWISEINLSLQNLEFLINFKKFEIFFKFFLQLENSLKNVMKDSVKKVESTPHASNKTSYLIPLIRSTDVPLMNLSLKKIRFLFPTEKEKNLILKIDNLNLTCQFENPLIRNFVQNSTSLSIYNKAKSNGLLHRPGFLFEDRQYLIEIKKISLLNNTKPILDEFEIRCILALPILFGKRLINGYAMEISIPTPNLSFYLSDSDLNSMFELIIENLEELKKHDFTQISTNQTEAKLEENLVELELVPLDLLITAENINFSFYKVDKDVLDPVVFAQLIQPHVCFFMHEKLQKFEISVFDLSVKRALSINKVSSGPDQIPDKSDYVLSVLETKPGEQDPKTGCLSGFMSFKITNFANLFCYDLNLIKKEKDKIDEGKETSFICVCNNCLRCFEMCKLVKDKDVLSSQINLERPVKLRANIGFYEDLVNFVSGLKMFNSPPQNELEPYHDEEHSTRVKEALIQLLFDLNIQLMTSQIVCVFELNTSENLYASLSGLSLGLSKTVRDDSTSSSLVKLLAKTLNKKNSDLNLSLNLNVTNHIFFKLNDFNLNLKINDDKLDDLLVQNIHVLGPVTIKAYLDYDMGDNELYSMVDLGSFNATFNRVIYQYVCQLKSIYQQHFPDESKFVKPTKTLEADSDQIENLGSLIINYEDDLRNGSLKYKIIDDNYFKKHDQSKTSIEYSLCHVLLPNTNEIVCIDDLTKSKSSCPDLTSSVCWRYSKTRALTSLKILPLPFVGFDQTTLKTINENQTNLKCHLEYFNMCSKCFVTLKEFCITEGLCTVVLDNILQDDKFSYKDLVYSKIWRIRLSTEAKQFIFASSLLASTRVDSIELSQSKKLINSHFELKISNFELKINTLNNQADLSMLNLSELSVRVLHNQPNTSSQVLSYLNLDLYSQLGVDYCEYRFLTNRSLIDSFQLKLKSSLNLNTNSLTSSLETDCINLQLSQSGLIALRQIENEFKSNGRDNLPHYYLIHNDTNLDINVKQFDTEETCLCQSGGFLPYTWRTHKKSQLIQLFLPKYKLISKPFQINENCLEELVIQLPNETSLNFLVNIDTKLANKSKTLFGSFKKFVSIQTNFLICNYTNLKIEKFLLKYNRQFEVSLVNGINEFSRSNTSFEFLSLNTGKVFKPQIDSIEANANVYITLKQDSLYDQLKSGLICNDNGLNTKYWVNLYEQSFSLREKLFKQYLIIFSPVLVICSYLPYNLSIEVSHQKYSLESNSVTYYTKNVDLNQLSIKFDHISDKSDKTDTLPGSINTKWFDQHVSLINEANSNAAETNSHGDKTLVHADLFKYKSINHQVFDNEFDFGIEFSSDKRSSPSTTEAKLEDQVQGLAQSKFTIDKSSCWGFSKTIRVDVRPECLVVNKTEYKMRIHQRFFGLNGDKEGEEIVHDIDQSGGQLCLSDLGSNNLPNKVKKYKLSVYLDEYSIEKNEHVDLAKNLSVYESDWIEIKDEPVSPFYRERYNSKMNCLYLNKCWIDVKLYPVNQHQSRFKLIYLVMSSDDRNYLNRNLNEMEGFGNLEKASNEELSKLYESTFRLLSIETKFLLKNKTGQTFKFNIFNDFNTFNHQHQQQMGLIHKYVQLEDNSLRQGICAQTGSVLNKRNFYLNQSSEEFIFDDFEIEKENLNDLFYFSISDESLVQSKPLVLTCKEKAIRQISSNGQLDDKLLISRQCFCVYENSVSKRTTPLILVQKLLVNKTGQLLLILKEDKKHLVDLHNCLDIDILVWPRLSTNFIFENYIRNINIITDRLLALDKSRSKQSKNNFDSLLRNSLIYMHRIPAKSCLKFNYDFIATNSFPIENLNEQIFFMFAVLGEEVDLSPNLCKIYDQKTQIGFEANKSLKLFYLSNGDSLTNERFITNDLNHVVEDNSEVFVKNLNFSLNLNIERLTLALNDDLQSQLHQTEILRLTIDTIGVYVTNKEDLAICLDFKHLQLDNQMFDLDSNSSSQKYDFPVIFLPRDQHNTNPKSNFKKSFDLYRNNENKFQDKFMEMRLNFKKNSDLNSLDLGIQPFDIYLEDYLIYNLIKIGLEFLELASINDQNDQNEPLSNLEISNDESDLDILARPVLKITRLSIKKIDALVSLQTSIKLYLATYKMPIIFDEFKLSGLPVCMVSSPQLVKQFTSHYLTSLLFRAGWLLGSLDLIGSPTAFIQQVSNGVFDFLQMPYRGLRNSGPTGLLQGLSSGSVSLIRNLSAGSITSMTSFASFVSRNMDILSFDPHHLARQEQFRHQTSDSFSSSLLQVSSSFIVSIMGAIGGLAEQPIQSVHNSDSLIKGVSKGLIGLVTKPVGAVAELVNQTGQGLLRITGVNRVPLDQLRLQRMALNKEFSRYSVSSTKCLWKLLNTSLSRIQINAMIDAVYTLSLSKSSLNLTPCYLVLSDDILYIVDKNEDMLLRAFYLSQIDVRIVGLSNLSETVLCVTLNSEKVELFINEYQKLYENTMDRLVDFVIQTSRPNEEEKGLPQVRLNSFVADYYQFSRVFANGCFNPNSSLNCLCGSKIKCVSDKNESYELDVRVSESGLGLAKLASHSRQLSSGSEMPKIHRIPSVTSQIEKKSDLVSVVDSVDQKKFFYYVDPRLSSNFINIFNSLKRKCSNKGFQF